MEGYLGEFDVDLATTPYADNTPVNWAMYFIGSYGQLDGQRHLRWTLDQVARILKGTPVIVKEARWAANPDHPDGFAEYRITTGEPSQAYHDWVAMMRGEGDEEDGEYWYDDGSGSQRKL